MERIRQLLEQYRHGERGLPTYKELVTIAYDEPAPCVKEGVPCAYNGVCPECPLLRRDRG